MTTKSPANTAHDAARAEDARRAHAELHAYITSLERGIAEVTRERDVARREAGEARRAAEMEHREHEATVAQLAAAERERDEARQQRDEVTRERDQARAAERTFALRLRLVHEALGDPECEVVLTSDLVTRRLHEAEERGARWALEAVNALVDDLERKTKAWGGTAFWRGCQARNDFDATRICAEARAKGGE